MNTISDRFWDVSQKELMRGYIYDSNAEEFVCLVCGQRFQKGVIYSDGEIFYEAEKYMRVHMEREHVSMFQYLLGLNKKYTGLTDLQKSVLELTGAGLSDKAIAEKLGIGSTSTVRNHRFALREKEKQARIFLAVMELLKEHKGETGPTRTTSVAVRTEEPSEPTEEEVWEVFRRYFPEGTDGPLSAFPTKAKRKIIVLREIAKRFRPDQEYSEKEVNTILSDVFQDHVMIRRYLVDYGFMDRAADGSAYWLKRQEKEETKVNRAELKQQYKEMKKMMGILQIKNEVNGKIFITSGRTLNGLVNRHQFQLKMKGHPNKELQNDWNAYGEEHFTFDIIETLEENPEPDHDNLADLKDLEQMWLEKLQPFGDKGYNKR